MDEQQRHFFEENRESVTNTVENRFGKALARKASPALMMSLAVPAAPQRERAMRGMAAAASTESVQAPGAAAILEFDSGTAAHETVAAPIAPSDLARREKEV